VIEGQRTGQQALHVVFEQFPSLSGFTQDTVLLLAVGFLIVTGGIGVLVLVDLAAKRSWKRFSLNTKAVVLASAFLLVVGFLGYLAAEFGNPKTIGPFDLGGKVSNALFHSVSTRTAGFNTVSVGDTRDETQFLTMILMFIGGAVGSTAGGIKVTTVTILFLATWASIRGRDHATGFGRRFHSRLVYRAIAIASLSLSVVATGAFILSATEVFDFRRILFEVVSAMGTVGLSTGITPDLSLAGKLTVAAIMFVGRLGPLSVAYLLAERSKEPQYELPEGHVAIG
jgi:trk system potassium uptake protein TrkH